jgi:peptide/nickel transport system permease protein
MSISAAETVELLDEHKGAMGGPTEERAVAAPAHRKSISRAGLIWRRVRAKPRFWIGGGALILMILWAFVGPLFTGWNLNYEDVNYFNYPPTTIHWFGTDVLGHDLYSEVMSGLQKSLIIGFVAGPMSTLIAAIVGAIAGYIGGAVDSVIGWFINMMLVLPTFFILVLLYPFTQGNWGVMTVFIAVTDWMIMAQVIRSQTKSLREREFVKAARYMGFNTWSVVTRHIIPNVASLLIVDAALGIGGAILTESTLSFFGFGVQLPAVSLGNLLANGEDAATTRTWLFAYPAAALVLLLLAVALVGDALRDAVDPTSGVNRS